MTIMLTMNAIMIPKVFQRICLAANMVHQIADYAGNINTQSSNSSI